MRTMIGSDWSPTRKGLGRQTLLGVLGVGILTWLEHFNVPELTAGPSLPPGSCLRSHSSRVL